MAGKSTAPAACGRWRIRSAAAATGTRRRAGSVDSASSGSTSAGTSKTVMSPTSMRSSLAGAALIRAVGGRDDRGVVARHRMQADIGGVGLAQDHQRGAAVDHEADMPAVDAGIDAEMAVAAARQLHLVLTGRSLRRLFGDLHRRRLRRGSLHHGLVGVAREIAAGGQHRDGEDENLTHGKARCLRPTVACSCQGRLNAAS